VCEEQRELIAADMGDELHECPLCLDYIYDDGTCSCTDELKKDYENFLNSLDAQQPATTNEATDMGVKRNKGKESRWKGAGFGDYECRLCDHRTTDTQLKECSECGATMDTFPNPHQEIAE